MGFEPLELGDHVEVAGRMVDILKAEGPIVVDRASDRYAGSLYQYQEDLGIWRRLSHHELHGRFQVFAGAPIVTDKGTKPLYMTDSFLKGAINCLVTRPELQYKGFFEDAPIGVAFSNGFVRVNPGGGTLDEEGGTALEFVPHSPDNRAQWLAPCDWDMQHSGGAWRSFLASVFPGDKDHKTRTLLQEYIGASIFGIAAKLQTCLIWIGDGANGKGTLTETIAALFPDGQAVSISPTKWSKDALAIRFRDALINIVDELPSQSVADGPIFKSVIAGDLVTCDQKYKDSVEFRPRAGHIFSTNSLPEWHDPSHGMWRRLIPIDFPRIFKRSDPDWLPGPVIKQRLIDDLPGIYNCVLRHGARIVVRGVYTIPRASKEFKSEWRDDAKDSVELWVMEGEDYGAGDGWQKVADRYAAYQKWARKKGLNTLSQPMWSRRLKVLKWQRRRKTNYWESAPPKGN